MAKSVDDGLGVRAEADVDRVLGALIKPGVCESIQDDTDYTDKPANIQEGYKFDTKDGMNKEEQRKGGIVSNAGSAWQMTDEDNKPELGKTINRARHEKK